MMSNHLENNLPGAELVEKGLADLRANRISDCSLVLLVAGPRLRDLGIEIPQKTFSRPYHHLLYEHLEDKMGADAYSCYRSLLRRIVSFAHALEQRKESALNTSNAPTE